MQTRPRIRDIRHLLKTRRRARPTNTNSDSDHDLAWSYFTDWRNKLVTPTELSTHNKDTANMGGHLFNNQVIRKPLGYRRGNASHARPHMFVSPAMDIVTTQIHLASS